MNLFKKIAAFTDLHIGGRSNSQTHLTDCEEFVDWFIETSQKNGCETGIFLGDWSHNRNNINLVALDTSIRLLEKLGKSFENFYWFPGNHDLFYRDRREIHSSIFGKHIPGITVVEKMTTIGDVTMIPWLVGDEWKHVAKLKSKYVFGHLELPEFYLNAGVIMPDHGQLQLAHFKSQDYVFSGHFHKRQNKGKAWYIGNAFPHNYGDAGDDKRGMMTLEWDGEPTFHNWSNAPKFRTLKLSELVDHTESIMKSKMYLRVELDMDITFEEANFIKENFMKNYDVREISLIQSFHSVDEVGSDDAPAKFDSVDSIVIDELMKVDSDTFDKNILLDTYNNL